ncbi:hypothetical protein GGX14DRAFT_565357 [Mycena pura]|uniref:Uncharacterized protein n=1 Tax=Mycena pura TaxID=153505 RepID=A0AAD6VF00_9AGAR|nr:hypothetical protein GGX14DRAFT_565357 [Mycena pura]
MAASFRYTRSSKLTCQAWWLACAVSYAISGTSPSAYSDVAASAHASLSRSRARNNDDVVAEERECIVRPPGRLSIFALSPAHSPILLIILAPGIELDAVIFLRLLRIIIQEIVRIAEQDRVG